MIAGEPPPSTGGKKPKARRPKAAAPPQVSDQAYRAMVETSHDLIWSVDAAGRWTFVNAAARRIYGYEPAEMLGRPFMEFETPEQAAKDLAVFALIKAGAPHFNYETEHRRKDGTPVWLSFNAVVLRDDRGTVLGTTGTAQDITERKRAEAALRESEERLRKVFDSMFVFVGVITPDGCISELNQAAVATSGLAREALLGLPLADGPWWAHSVEMRERIKRMVRRAAQGEIVREELVGRVFGGGYITADTTFSPLRDAAGCVTQIIGSAVDITERRQAEDKLCASQSRLLAAERVAHLGNWSYEVATGAIEWSDGLYRIFGLAPRSTTVTYESLLAAVHPDDRARHDDYLARMLALSPDAPLIEKFDYRLTRPDGALRWVEVFCESEFDGQGKPTRYFGTVQDFTERRAAEDALRVSESRLRRVVESDMIGMLFWNLAGEITGANEAFLRIVGYTLEEVRAGRVNWREMTPPEYRDLDEKALREVAATGACVPFEKEFVRKDGSRVPILIGGAALPEQPGQGIAFVVELTGRKQAEAARERSLSLVRATLESTADGILVVNNEGKIETYNRLFAEMWRIPEEVLAARDDGLAMQFALEQLASPDAFLDKVTFLYGHPAEESFDTLDFKDGRVFERYSRPQYFGGQVVGRVWSFRDITARKQAEEALRESDRRMKTLLSNLPGYVYRVANDRDYTPQFISEGVYKITGYTHEEYLVDRSITCGAEIVEADREAVSKIVQEAVAAQRPYECEYRIRTKAGELKWAWERGQGNRSQSGELTSLEGFVTDITARKQAEAELQASEARFKTMFAQAPMGIALIDSTTGRHLAVNPMLAKITGRSVEELTATDWMSITHPDDVQPDKDNMARITAADLGGFWMEKRYLRPDGEVVWINLTIERLKVDDPAQPRHLAMIEDITARKMAEESERKNREQFIDLFDNAPIGYHELDGEGRLTRINQTELSMLGYTAEELLGEYMWKISADEKLSRQTVMANLDGSQAPLLALERVFRRKDGTTFPVLVENRILRRADGTISGIRSVVQDITARKEAEENARHLATFPELNPNPVLEFAAGGALGYSNPAALTMAKMIGFDDLSELLPANTSEIVAECLASGQPRLRLETQHGRHTLSWSFYPIAHQRLVHCYVGDISKRQLLEEQLRQAQKMDAIGQLAGGVAHDFNNLLTVIIGHLGMLRANPGVTPEIGESLAQINGAAKRAANLTRQLLAFSRHQVMNVRDLDLNEVVTNLAKMLRRVLGEDVAMHVDFQPEALIFNGDPGMMEQVLLNLAINARDAMPTGGTLRLITRAVVLEAGAGSTRTGSFVRLSVSDTGTGIAPEVLPRIFEPFFTTKEVGKGTGLGLATLFGIVQQHRGWTEVESELGRGTTFHVYLPRLDSRPPQQPVENPALPERGRGETILLVEDEPNVREIGVVALEQNGYRMLAAANGKEALEVFAVQKEEISLLLTDLIMPGGLSGLQLARELLKQNPKLRVIYTSGYSAEIAGKELKMKDGVNYLPKPFELEKLLATVRAALDSKGSRSPF